MIGVPQRVDAPEAGQPALEVIMANAKPLPPVEVLREHFSYDPEKGTLSLKKSFNHNGLKVGQPLGYKNSQGYMRLCFRGERYLVHRIIWALMTGGEPSQEIDHANRDKTDNRWCNLRSCTKAQNRANRKTWGKTMAGAYKNCCGTTWHSSGNGRRLGNFATEQEAHDAYVKWHRETYGEFSAYAA